MDTTFPLYRYYILKTIKPLCITEYPTNNN